MKISFSTVKFNWLILVLLFGLMSLQACSQAATKPFSIDESPLPAATEPVNDFAGVLDDTAKQALDQRIKDFKAQTNPQVVLAVAIVKTTGDRDIFDYSLAVARGWKIGTKESDNPSALLFIAIDDHKYYTQVSRDLEDELPDGVAGSLQRQFLVPAFKQGNYAKGISDTIDAYISTIQAKQGGGGQPISNNLANRQQSRTAKGSSGGSSIVTCLIILFILMLVIFSRFGNRSRNSGSRWGGGGFGGSALPWIVGGILGGMGGNGGGSSSGGWGGGSSGGGGDWGGFGGGGDFGGGGAGGSW